MKKRFVFLLTAALCLALAIPATAMKKGGAGTEFERQNPALIAGFEESARHLMAVDGIPGMSIALTDEKGILWAEGFGYTDSAHTRLVDADTIFSIQSISKTVTGTAIVEAANRGVLDLDKPITDYLPDFTVNSVFEDHPERRMTLKNLLSHTAGFTHEAFVGSNDDANAQSFEEHIKSISKSWLRFPVGQDYSYSNLGIDLAGYILQSVSGQSYQSYVDQYLTGPAGMTNSTFDMARIKANPNRALGYSARNYEMPVAIPMIPSGGFYTSANDLAKFIQHHLNNADALKEMYTIPFPINHQTEGYALGVVRTDKYNTYYLNHNGGGFGFIASLTWYPELKIGVVVLTNSADTPAGYLNPFDLGMEILDGVIVKNPTVYNARMMQLSPPSKPAISDATLQTKMISDVQQGLIAVKNKPMPDEARLGGYAGTYTATATGVPFFYAVSTITEQYGRLYKDGGALTETQPGLFFDGYGEALDLRGDTKTFSDIPIKKLPFGLAFIELFPEVFFALFLAAIVLLVGRRKKCRSVTPEGTARAARIAGAAGAGLNLLFILSIATIIIFLLQILNNQAPDLQMYHVYGYAVLAMRILTPLVLLSTAAAIVFCAFAWFRKWWLKFDRIFFSGVSALGVLFILFLLRMNVLIF
jgi:CubicO group peptidase (beta-lactamase class C family)